MDGDDVGSLAFIDRALNDVGSTVRPGIELTNQSVI
jgi:hypothetical protein